MDITGALYAISNTNSSGEQRSEASTLPVSAVEKHAYKYRNNYVIIKYTYAKNYIGELTGSALACEARGLGSIPNSISFFSFSVMISLRTYALTSTL